MLQFELIFWVAAILLLFFLPENITEPSFCVFKWAGFSSCLGCGLGHAIHDTLHLQLINAFHHHPMGTLAVLIIFNRIKQLILPKQAQHETQHY